MLYHGGGNKSHSRYMPYSIEYRLTVISYLQHTFVRHFIYLIDLYLSSMFVYRLQRFVT